MSPRLRVLGVAVLALACLSHSPIHAQEAPLAVLMTPEGEVSIRRGTESLAGVFGMHLTVGDEVRTGGDSRVDILYSDGQVLRLGERGSLTLAEGLAHGVGDRFAAVDRLLTLRESRGTSAIGTVRGRTSAEIVAVSPRASSRIRVGHPVFRWSGGSEGQELEVSLEHEGDLVWKSVVQGANSLAYPDGAPPLIAGASYAWRVRSIDPLAASSAQSQTAFFETLTQDQADSVDHSLAEIAALDVSDATRVILTAGQLVDAGLVDEAIARLNDALARGVGEEALRPVRDTLVGSYHP